MMHGRDQKLNDQTSHSPLMYGAYLGSQMSMNKSVAMSQPSFEYFPRIPSAQDSIGKESAIFQQVDPKGSHFSIRLANKPSVFSFKDTYSPSHHIQPDGRTAFSPHRSEFQIELEKVSFSADKDQITSERLLPEAHQNDGVPDCCGLRAILAIDSLIFLTAASPVMTAGILDNPLFLVLGGLCVCLSIWSLVSLVASYLKSSATAAKILNGYGDTRRKLPIAALITGLVASGVAVFFFVAARGWMTDYRPKDILWQLMAVESGVWFFHAAVAHWTNKNIGEKLSLMLASYYSQAD